MIQIDSCVLSALASGKTFPNLIRLEDACAKAVKIWPDWEMDFKQIRQKYYTEETARTGYVLLESASKMLLSLNVESARRYVDVALSE